MRGFRGAGATVICTSMIAPASQAWDKEQEAKFYHDSLVHQCMSNNIKTLLECALLHHGFVAASMQDYPDMRADQPCATCCHASFGTQPAVMITMQGYPDMHADKPCVTCKVLPRTCCHAVSRMLRASATQKLRQISQAKRRSMQLGRAA